MWMALGYCWPLNRQPRSPHEVVDVVDVELVATVKLKQNVGLPMIRSSGCDRTAAFIACRGLEDLLGVAPVALAAELHHRRPRRGDQPAGARALDARRHVLAAGPAGQEEVLAVAQRLVAEQQGRRALERVAVLVGVGRDAGDAGDAEVEHRDVVAELLAEREDEPAEAAVDVQADAAARGELAELVDRVDGAVAGSCRPSP